MILKRNRDAAVRDGVPDGAVKCIRPLIAAGHAPVYKPEVMNDIAACEDHGAFTAQRLQSFPDLEKRLWRGVDIGADHDDRNIRFRIHIGENAPDAVIDSPGMILSRCIAEELQCFAGEFRRSCRRVLHFVQFFRKPVHIQMIRV